MSQQSYDRFKSQRAQLEAQFGPDWESKDIISLIDGTYKLATPYQNMNPANPTGEARFTTRENVRRETGDGYEWVIEEKPIENPAGWDTNRFGNLADWAPTDILPGTGQTAQQHVDQLNAHDFGEISSSPNSGSWLTPLTGFGAVLGAGLLGNSLMGAGAAGGGGGASGGMDFLAANDAAMAAGGAAPSILSPVAGGGAAGLAGFDPLLLSDPLLGVAGATAGAGAAAPSLINLANSAGTVPTDLTPPGGFPATPGVPGAAGGAGTAASGTGTALQRLLNGTATLEDYLSLGGTAGATALGAYSADKQTDAFKSLADTYMGFGAPSRARYEGSFAPGFSMQNEPGYTDAMDSVMDSYLRKASTGGNPFDNPGVSQEIIKGVNSSLAFPALQNYRNQNAATGGYSAFNTAAPKAAGTAIDSQPGMLTNIAGGLSNILNPQPQQQQQPFSLADLMRQYGLNTGGTLA